MAPPILLLAVHRFGHRVLAKVELSEESVLGRVGRFAEALTLRVHSFRAHPGTLAANVALTGVKWLVMALLYLWAFRAFGTTVGLVPAATIPVISSLVGYLPVTVGGIGTMEWTAVALFGGLGIAGPAVLMVYLFLRAVLLVAALLLLVGIRGTGPGKIAPFAS